MCLPVYNCLSVCLRICSAPVQKHVGSQYVIFHFVLANKLFWWVCQYRKSCQYVVNLILMSVQKNTLFASIFFFHTVCQYIFFSFCTGIGKCWYASTKKSILYWHEDLDFYDELSPRTPPPRSQKIERSLNRPWSIDTFRISRHRTPPVTQPIWFFVLVQNIIFKAGSFGHILSQILLYCTASATSRSELLFQTTFSTKSHHQIFWQYKIF